MLHLSVAIGLILTPTIATRQRKQTTATRRTTLYSASSLMTTSLGKNCQFLSRQYAYSVKNRRSSCNRRICSRHLGPPMWFDVGWRRNVTWGRQQWCQSIEQRAKHRCIIRLSVGMAAHVVIVVCRYERSDVAGRSTAATVRCREGSTWDRVWTSVLLPSVLPQREQGEEPLPQISVRTHQISFLCRSPLILATGVCSRCYVPPLG